MCPLRLEGGNAEVIPGAQRYGGGNALPSMDSEWGNTFILGFSAWIRHGWYMGNLCRNPTYMKIINEISTFYNFCKPQSFFLF